MNRRFQYPVSEADSGKLVETFLKNQGYSRHLMIALKKTPQGITISGVPVYTNYRLNAGEVLTIKLPPEQNPSPIVPTPMNLDIIYEDEDILVINKAKNTPIHPSQGNYTNTLANGVAWYYEQKGEPFVYRVINRLDRDTTGLLILGKNPLSTCILSSMLRSHNIHRTYLAAVHGNLFNLFSPDMAQKKGVAVTAVGEILCGSIHAPIARVYGSTIERQVDFSEGEPAVTHFQLLTYTPHTDTSVVNLQLETGRTHQIRVHMNYLGYPLYGDFLYYPDYRFIDRQSLHSWMLSFHHPITKEPLTFTAAVPEDMSIFM